jgi:transcriptional regulator with XRE-family HTH domain
MQPARTKLMRLADRRAVELRRATGTEIERLRTDAGLTLADLARATGLDRSYVARIETGDREPSMAAWCRIAAALGADPVRRLYPNTGPPVRDRWQARILEALLELLHRLGPGTSKSRSAGPRGASSTSCFIGARGVS